MDHYAGIDVLLEQSSVCVVDAGGKIIREDKVCASARRVRMGGTGIADSAQARAVEAQRCGEQSAGHFAWLRAQGRQDDVAPPHPPALAGNQDHAARGQSLWPHDARGIAQLMRLGWFRPVHCKSIGAQDCDRSSPGMALNASRTCRVYSVARRQDPLPASLHRAIATEVPPPVRSAPVQIAKSSATRSAPPARSQP